MHMYLHIRMMYIILFSKIIIGWPLYIVKTIIPDKLLEDSTKKKMYIFKFICNLTSKLKLYFNYAESQLVLF